MSTFEQLLSVELHAETEHIEVSELDVGHAQHRYERRRIEANHRRRLVTTVAAVAAVATVVAGGTYLSERPGRPAPVAPAAPPASSLAPHLLPLATESIQGVWRMGGGGWL